MPNRKHGGGSVMVQPSRIISSGPILILVHNGTDKNYKQSINPVCVANKPDVRLM